MYDYYESICKYFKAFIIRNVYDRNNPTIKIKFEDVKRIVIFCRLNSNIYGYILTQSY